LNRNIIKCFCPIVWHYPSFAISGKFHSQVLVFCVLQALLSQTAVIKLNGGLGTSMGLEKAKSLLTVKDGKTFLDLIAEQVSLVLLH
jgi:UDP-N-acetylglucosamine pyrophosphorylase